MDEIQKVLIKVGRKDLAQEYYKKVASDDKVVKTYEVFRDNWNVGKLFSMSDAKKMVKFFESLPHASATNFKPDMWIRDGHTYLNDEQIEKLKKLGIKPEILER